MTVHFCPHCGRLNLADFVYCPYCGSEVAPGPGLEEALEKPLERMETAIAAPGAGEELERLERSLDLLERDMDEFLSAGRMEAGKGKTA